MNIATTSVGRVIDKIYRDLRPNHPNWETDAIEWVGEALAHIGSGPQMEMKSALLDVVSHRALLPPDFVREHEVFRAEQGLNDVPLSVVDWTGIPSFLPSQTFEIPDGYVMSGSEVHTSFETGQVRIQYTAYSLDDEGYPLVPDDPNYLDAFLWYIVKQLMVGGWRHPNPQITFETSERRWLRYCSQARQQSKMPSVPEYDTFLKRWVQLVPNHDPRNSSPARPTILYGSAHIERPYQ